MRTKNDIIDSKQRENSQENTDNKKQYLPSNRCDVELCIYNDRGRCFCKIDEMKRGKDNTCESFVPRNRKSKGDLRAFVGDTKIVLLAEDLREFKGTCKEYIVKKKHPIEIVKCYPTRCLVSYNIGKTKLYTDVDNQTIIKKVLEQRRKEWEEEYYSSQSI